MTRKSDTDAAAEGAAGTGTVAGYSEAERIASLESLAVSQSEMIAALNSEATALRSLTYIIADRIGLKADDIAAARAKAL